VVPVTPPFQVQDSMTEPGAARFKKEVNAMKRPSWSVRRTIYTGVCAAALVLPLALAAEEPAKNSSYVPVAIGEDFSAIMARMKAAKAGVEKRQADLRLRNATS
jgi:hypothetical protein